MEKTHNDNLHFQPSPHSVIEKINEIKSFYERDDISLGEKRLILEAIKNDYGAMGEISSIANMLKEFIGVVIQNLNANEDQKETSEDDEGTEQALEEKGNE